MGFISSEKMPIIWRGPMVSGAIMQLISQTNWGKLDYLIIDTPPGTGDIQLTLLQKIALSGAIVVTTPQDIAVTDTAKGIEMLNRLNLQILGLVENMSYFEPKDSKKRYYLYGKGGARFLSEKYNLDLLGEIPQFEFNQSNLVFTLGILAPLLIAIGQGLPTNCLDFKSSLIKELGKEASTNFIK